VRSSKDEKIIEYENGMYRAPSDSTHGAPTNEAAASAIDFLNDDNDDELFAMELDADNLHQQQETAEEEDEEHRTTEILDKIEASIPSASSSQTKPPPKPAQQSYEKIPQDIHCKQALSCTCPISIRSFSR